ncbi:MAG: toast rack family protein [Chloroflexota bacterium]
MKSKILFVISSLVLASMACGFQANLPAMKTPGPDKTDQISAVVPEGDINLNISFSAGNLSLSPGAKDLFEGTATYNIADLKPEIKINNGNVDLSQGQYQVTGIPSLSGIKNDWKLKLGSVPMSLSLNAGAYEGNFDFGGLSIKNLTINDGASKITADFSSPNHEKLNIFSYKTGASNVTLKNLGNANFSNMVFESGAGNYTLDFNGGLQRDANVNIRSGMSNLTLTIPTGIPATVKVSSGLSNVQFPASWNHNGDNYTQPGEGPILTILVEMGAGNVQINQ